MRKRFFTGSAEIYNAAGEVCAEGKATYAVAPVDQIVGRGVSMDDVWFMDDRPDPDAN